MATEPRRLANPAPGRPMTQREREATADVRDRLSHTQNQPIKYDGRADAPQEQPQLSQEAGESAYKALEYQKWMQTRHRQNERFPIALPQKQFFAKCEFGMQLFTFFEGQIPVCPDCGNTMQTIALVPAK